MADEAAIKAEIEANVPFWTSWKIGVTADPDRRKSERGNPFRWHQWNADTETIARNIESFCLEKGMTGDAGSESNATWVYIFI